jgi:hypothetical protein
VRRFGLTRCAGSVAVQTTLVIGGIVVVVLTSANALAEGIAHVGHFEGHQPGIVAKANSYTVPALPGQSFRSASQQHDTAGISASTASSRASVAGPVIVVSQLALHCLSQVGQPPGLGQKGSLQGLQCVSLPRPPPSQPVRTKHGKKQKPAPPSPQVLARLAIDKAIALAVKPEIRIAPARVGLTGLDSYFWISPRPHPVAATAAVPGVAVTARAQPAQYLWRFGDGAELVSHGPGRPWTRDLPGSIAHQYQARDRYTVSVQIIWRASWRTGVGGWQDLGFFSTSGSHVYPVRQAVAVLVRS